jgi:hypothetical protein
MLSRQELPLQPLRKELIDNRLGHRNIIAKAPIAGVRIKRLFERMTTEETCATKHTATEDSHPDVVNPRQRAKNGKSAAACSGAF